MHQLGNIHWSMKNLIVAISSRNYCFPLPWQISIVSSSSVCGRAWRSSTPSALKFWLTSSCMGLLQVKHSCCECSHGMSRDQHFTAPLLNLIHKQNSHRYKQQSRNYKTLCVHVCVCTCTHVFLCVVYVWVCIPTETHAKTGEAQWVSYSITRSLSEQRVRLIADPSICPLSLQPSLAIWFGCSCL